jgi:hypothetical protein
MKTIFYILLIYLLISCETKNIERKSTDITIRGFEVEIYIIDSCEYIGRFRGYNNDAIAHKGNCKFCHERNK